MQETSKMSGLVWLALVLAVVWVVGVMVFKLLGLAIHLALVAAGLCLALWAFRRVRSLR